MEWVQSEGQKDQGLNSTIFCPLLLVTLHFRMGGDVTAVKGAAVHAATDT